MGGGGRLPSSYVEESLSTTAVNVAVAIHRPLLVKGEPGTGKTLLAQTIAASLGMPLLRWQVKSTSRAVDGLYHYDAVRRLHDSRFGEGDVSDLRAYIRYGVLGEAFRAKQRPVLLIDELDRSDERDVRRHLARLLPAHAVPSAFVRVDAIPLNDNGKVAVGRLPAPDRTQRLGDQEPAATETEEVIAGVWARVLGLEAVSVTAPFFDQGGTSLRALEMIVSGWSWVIATWRWRCRSQAW